MSQISNVLFNHDTICAVTYEDVAFLKSLALQSPLKRARLCMHLSPEDAIQEMIIAFHHETYIRPHRHIDQSESVHMIEGEALIAFFDDTGQVTRLLHLRNQAQTFMYRLSHSSWHTVLPLTEYAVLHETVTGPQRQAEFPPWEPEQTPTAISSFKQKILENL